METVAVAVPVLDGALAVPPTGEVVCFWEVLGLESFDEDWLLLLDDGLLVGAGAGSGSGSGSGSGVGGGGDVKLTVAPVRVPKTF